MTNKIPDFRMKEVPDLNNDVAFAGKKTGKMFMGHDIKLNVQSTERAAGSQRGHFFQKAQRFFGNILQKIGPKTAAVQPNITLQDKKFEADGKIKNLFDRIQLNQGAVPLNVDKPTATFTDRRTVGAETPMNIDKVMASFTALKREDLKQLKSQFVADNLLNLRTMDMRHLLSVGKVHGVENKEEGEKQLSWAMDLIGYLFEEYKVAQKLDAGQMQVLEGVLGKLKAGTEFARILEQRYYGDGVDDKTLKDAANRLINNIDNSPVIFQVGCFEHCVGLEVERGDDGKVHVRISNLGVGLDELYNPEIFKDSDNQEIYAYVPTYEFACEDDAVAEQLVFNLMKAFNEAVEQKEMYECFNKEGIEHISPPEDKAYYRPPQEMGNCVFRNVFEAVYNCLHRNDIPPENFQEYVFACAKEVVKNGDVYPELQNAAEKVTPPQFFKKKQELL